MTTSMRYPLRRAVSAIALLTCFVGAAAAAEPYPAAAPKPDIALAGSPPAGLAAKTLGGVQFWGDELFFHDWRMRTNDAGQQYKECTRCGAYRDFAPAAGAS